MRSLTLYKRRVAVIGRHVADVYVGAKVGDIYLFVIFTKKMSDVLFRVIHERDLSLDGYKHCLKITFRFNQKSQSF